MNLGEDLYREVILDHISQPRNRGPLECASHKHEGLNPVCGDQVEILLDIQGDTVAQARFQGTGCSISQASASMLAEQIQGLSVSAARDLAEHFKTFMKSRESEPPDGLGDLEALAGVRKYPVRIKCALLAWTTLLQALEETPNE